MQGAEQSAHYRRGETPKIRESFPSRIQRMGRPTLAGFCGGDKHCYGVHLFVDIHVEDFYHLSTTREQRYSVTLIHNVPYPLLILFVAICQVIMELRREWNINNRRTLDKK